MFLAKLMENTKKMANETESKLKEKTQELANKFEHSGVQDKIAEKTDAAVTKTLSVGVEVYLKSTDMINGIKVRNSVLIHVAK